jgi:hypothetical protein
VSSCDSMETKLACIKQASFFTVLLDSFRITLSNSLPFADKRTIGRKFWVHMGFDNDITSASF